MRKSYLYKAGYCYRKTTHSAADPSKTFWTCQKTRPLNCGGRAITDGSYIIQHGLDHNHSPPEIEVQIQDEAQFIKSNRGRPILVDKDGYCYYKSKNSNVHKSRIIWACQRHRQYNCPARATTEGFHIVKYLHKHDHQKPDIVEIQEKGSSN